MRLFEIIAAGSIGLTIGMAGQAAAQGQPPETPLYTTGTSMLDKNYGLPSFGMPGSELPQQRATVPEARTPEQPDFFKGSSDLSVPPNRRAAEADSEMETPRYTTSEETTDGSAGGGNTSSETPLFGTAAMSFGTRPAR
jgi:hypothetical protein